MVAFIVHGVDLHRCLHMHTDIDKYRWMDEHIHLEVRAHITHQQLDIWVARYVDEKRNSTHNIGNSVKILFNASILVLTCRRSQHP